MIEKIQNTYINPKVELTLKEYNDLVALAQMKTKKIEERAREIYEKEGVAKIQFTGRFNQDRYGEIDSKREDFTVDCAEYCISPSGEYEKSLCIIPLESRKKIAEHVKRFVRHSFETMYGENLTNINRTRSLVHDAEKFRNRFIIWTISGWALATLMLIFSL